MKYILSTLVVLIYISIGAFSGCAQQTETTKNITMDYKKDQVILEVALTPGGPGSNNYAYTVYADGRVALPGQIYSIASYQLSAEQVEEIHSRLATINFAKLNEEKNTALPKPQVLDGQSVRLNSYQNGQFYRLIYQLADAPIPNEVNDFHTYFLALIAGLEEQEVY